MAIEETVGYTRVQLQIEFEASQLNVENTENEIAELRYAMENENLDVEKSLNGEERSKNLAELAKKELELAQGNWLEYQSYTMKTMATETLTSVAEAGRGLAKANGTLSNARISVDNAEIQLDYTKITAPVAGEITEINITKHNMAASGSPAYVISPKDRTNITFFVSDKIMENLSEGQELRMERNGVLYKATISSVSTVVDNSNGQFQVEAVVQGDSSNLIDGSSVKVTIATEKAESVMALPINSIYYDNQAPYVFCVVNGKAVKTDIEIGLANEDVVQVMSGIAPDSQIIISSSSALSDGATVVISEPATAQGEE